MLIVSGQHVDVNTGQCIICSPQAGVLILDGFCMMISWVVRMDTYGGENLVAAGRRKARAMKRNAIYMIANVVPSSQRDRYLTLFDFIVVGLREKLIANIQPTSPPRRRTTTSLFILTSSIQVASYTLPHTAEYATESNIPSFIVPTILWRGTIQSLTRPTSPKRSRPTTTSDQSVLGLNHAPRRQRYKIFHLVGDRDAQLRSGNLLTKPSFKTRFPVNEPIYAAFELQDYIAQLTIDRPDRADLRKLLKKIDDKEEGTKASASSKIVFRNKHRMPSNANHTVEEARAACWILIHLDLRHAWHSQMRWYLILMHQKPTAIVFADAVFS
ncbi:hypothetical protein E6O75_ATG00612 [Venturia nashicola]|uniref:Uncharacterized protein n=1 Tax=Venturia nashicola TaxID=86259 RepID=A0A4Z1PEB0_9PEZI|nr:hypothetical protein E6O75_ATG00612 [Venturia nashicola]